MTLYRIPTSQRASFARNHPDLQHLLDVDLELIAYAQRMVSVRRLSHASEIEWIESDYILPVPKKEDLFTKLYLTLKD